MATLSLAPAAALGASALPTAVSSMFCADSEALGERRRSIQEMGWEHAWAWFPFTGFLLPLPCASCMAPVVCTSGRLPPCTSVCSHAHAQGQPALPVISTPEAPTNTTSCSPNTVDNKLRKKEWIVYRSQSRYWQALFAYIGPPAHSE